LIGKGCDVRIHDRNVAIARLVGANRRYIVEEIPHISSLMCDQLSELIAHAEVLVIGSAGADTDQLLQSAAPDQLIVDLTRGALKPRVDVDARIKPEAETEPEAENAAAAQKAA